LPSSLHVNTCERSARNFHYDVQEACIRSIANDW
jgi:hypothetical protein